MTFWTIPHDAIRAAAARKASVPLWRVGAVRVTSGLWCYVRVIDGPTVVVTERDVLLEESVRNGAGVVPLEEVP